MPRKTIVVLKLSGAIFFSEEFDKIAITLRAVARRRKNTRLVIVAGGGRIAREYISAANKLGIDQATQDELGIRGSRLNAIVLIKALGEIAPSHVPENLEELVETFEVTSTDKQIVVVGGMQPGQSTNAVAALICEKLGAKLFLNATAVDGVYTEDPQKFKGARRIPKITPQGLSKILGNESMKAGGYELMDPVALKLIERSKINTWIIKCDSRTITNFLLKDKKIGTRIIFKG